MSERSKRDFVDLAERVTATFYDEEYEEWTQRTVTIADVLDSVCDEYTILQFEQPEIIRCKDCKRHNVDIGDFREENGKKHFYWKDEACPLVAYRGKAQGHEYDYQFCAWAERRA